MVIKMSICRLCPRNCNVERSLNQGYCGAGTNLKIAKAMLHFGEEPCISGKAGSGAIFFSGCTLKCVFCQNHDISKENFGAEITVKRLVEIFYELENKGACNINLVSPTQYTKDIVKALEMSKSKLSIPIIYNTSGYEKLETIEMLNGLVDVYLPDLKYKDKEISKEYSKAENYFEIASKAILAMFKQTGKYKIGDNGEIEKGIIIRHLVLPGTRQDSKEIMNWIGENFDKDDILISLMSQYTPEFYKGDNKNLRRKVTTFEYNQVVDTILKYGFNGYMQDKSSATSSYTPKFNLEGVYKSI